MNIIGYELEKHHVRILTDDPIQPAVVLKIKDFDTLNKIKQEINRKIDKKKDRKNDLDAKKAALAVELDAEIGAP